MAKTDTKPVPDITIPVIAPPGGSSSDIGPVNLGGLFPAAVNGNGLTDAKTAQEAFARLAVSSPATLAQIQAQLYYAGFYAGTFAPTPGLLHPEDLAAFTSALKTASSITDEAGNPAANMKSYLANLATVGRDLGQGAAQRRQVNVVQHPNPAAVRAAVDQAYVSVLGRKATDGEKAAFLRTFDAEVVRAQTVPDLAQQAQEAALSAPPSAIDKAVGSPVPPRPTLGHDLAREVGGLEDPYLAGLQPPNPLGDPPDIGPLTGSTPGTSLLTGPVTGQPSTPTAPPGSGPALLTRSIEQSAAAAQIDLFLKVISRTESDGNAKAKNPHASASGLFGYIDSTWNHFGGYLHARDAPVEVQWAKARQDAANKFLAYGGDIRKVAMAWYLPAAVNNPALANSVPARSAGNTITPNQYADLILKRMASLSGGGAGGGTPPAPAPSGSGFDIPSGADALSPLRVDVTAPDLGAESVEQARAANPTEAGAHDVSLAFDSLLRLLGGQ